MPSFHDEFKPIIKHNKGVGYSMEIMWQYACLVINPITNCSYGPSFNCTMVGQTADSIKALIGRSVPDVCLSFGLPDPHWGSTGGFISFDSL